MAPPLNAEKAIESENIAFNNSTATEADFEAKCKAVALHSTELVHIAFDEPANTGSFLLPADTYVHIDPPCEFTRISALGNAGSGTLYILARR